jgi:hypothetical protein
MYYALTIPNFFIIFFSFVFHSKCIIKSSIKGSKSILVTFAFLFVFEIFANLRAYLIHVQQPTNGIKGAK